MAGTVTALSPSSSGAIASSGTATIWVLPVGTSAATSVRLRAAGSGLQAAGPPTGLTCGAYASGWAPSSSESAEFVLSAPPSGTAHCGVATVVFPPGAAPAQADVAWGAAATVRLPDWGITPADQLYYAAAVSPADTLVASAPAVPLGVLSPGAHAVAVSVQDAGGSSLWAASVTLTVLPAQAGSADPAENAAALTTAGATPSTAAASAASAALLSSLSSAATTAAALARAAAALDSLAAVLPASEARALLAGILRSAASAQGEASYQGAAVQFLAASQQALPQQRRPSALAAGAGAAFVLPGGSAAVALPANATGGKVVAVATQGLHPHEGANATDHPVGSAVSVQLPGSGPNSTAGALRIRPALPSWLLRPFPCDLRLREWDAAAEAWAAAQPLDPMQLPASALAGLTLRHGVAEGTVVGGDWEHLTVATGGGNESFPRRESQLVYPANATNPWCSSGSNDSSATEQVELPSSELVTVQAFVGAEVMPATNFGQMVDPGFYSFSEFRLAPVLMIGGIMALFWALLATGALFDRWQDEKLIQSFRDAQEHRVQMYGQKLLAKIQRKTEQGHLKSLRRKTEAGLAETLQQDEREGGADDADDSRDSPRHSSVAVITGHIPSYRNDALRCVPSPVLNHSPSAGSDVGLRGGQSPISLSGVAFSPKVGEDGAFSPVTTPGVGGPESSRLGPRGRFGELSVATPDDEEADGAAGAPPSVPPSCVKTPTGEKAAVLPPSRSTGRKRGPAERLQLFAVRPRALRVNTDLEDPSGGFADSDSRTRLSGGNMQGIVPAPQKEMSISVLSPRRSSMGITSPRVAVPQLLSPRRDIYIRSGRKTLRREVQSGALYCTNQELTRASAVSAQTGLSFRQPDDTPPPEDALPEPAPQESSRCAVVGHEVSVALKAHTWLAFFFRAAGGAYTRPQRITVLFSFLLTVLFILVVFSGRQGENATVARTITAAVLTSLLLMPVVVLLQTIFQRAKWRPPAVWYRRTSDSLQGQPILGELVVRVLEARCLPNLDDDNDDADDVSDPYVRVDCEDKSWKTVTIWNDLDPIYDGAQVVSFPVRDVENGQVCMTVFDDDGNQDDEASDVIGSVTVTMAYIMKRLARGDVGALAVIDEWLAISGEAVEQQGCQSCLRVIMEYTHFSQPVWECERDRKQHEAKQRGQVLAEDILGTDELRAVRTAQLARPAAPKLLQAHSPTHGEEPPVPLAVAHINLEDKPGLHLVVASSLWTAGGADEGFSMNTSVEVVQAGKQAVAGRTALVSGQKEAVYGAHFAFPCPAVVRRRSSLLRGFFRRLSGSDHVTFHLSLVETAFLLDNVMGTAVLSVQPGEIAGVWQGYTLPLAPRDPPPDAAAVGELRVWVTVRQDEAAHDQAVAHGLLGVVLGKLGIDLHQSAKEAPTSAKFSAFVFVVFAGLVLVGGWWRPPHIYIMVALYVCLCAATFLLLFKRALLLLLFTLGLLGCVSIFMAGNVAIGVAVAYLWTMLWAAALCKMFDPDLVPTMMSIYWAGHLAIVLAVYYGTTWWFGALMALAQLVSAGIFWMCAQLSDRGHLASAGFIAIWALHLATLLNNYGSLPHRKAVTVGSAERYVLPAAFGGVGLFVVLLNYRQARGGFIPQELPSKYVWAGYALAVLIQFTTALIVFSHAMQWTAESRDAFLRCAAIAFIQDIFFNEPLKLLLFPALKALAKTLSKSATGTAVRRVLEELGLMSLLSSLLS